MLEIRSYESVRTLIIRSEGTSLLGLPVMYRLGGNKDMWNRASILEVLDEAPPPSPSRHLYQTDRYYVHRDEDTYFTSEQRYAQEHLYHRSWKARLLLHDPLLECYVALTPSQIVRVLTFAPPAYIVQLGVTITWAINSL